MRSLRCGALWSLAASLFWQLPVGAAYGSPKQLRMPGSAESAPVGAPFEIPERRGRRLVAGVAVSASAVLAGALLLVPLGLDNGEDGTSLVGFMASGTSLIVVGGIATLVTATFLAHHRRWDAPPRRLMGDRDQATRAQLQRRRLLHTLIASSAVAVAGGVAIGIGYGAALACSDTQDTGCTGPRAIAGVAVGGPLVVGGAFGALSSGILLGLHKRHRHREVDEAPRLTIGAGSFAIRF